MDRLSIGKYISCIYRQVQIIINDKLEKYGIGSGQFIFLITVYKNEGINQQQLSEMLHIDKATTMKAVKKLIEKGLLKRERDKEDKRSYKLYLTQAGKDIIPYVIEELDHLTAILKGDLNDTEIIELFRLLDVVSNNAHDYVIKLKSKEK